MLLSRFALVAIGLASFTSAAPVATTAVTTAATAATRSATTASRKPTLDDLATSAKTADVDTLTRLELALELGNAPAHSAPRVQRRSNYIDGTLCSTSYGRKECRLCKNGERYKDCNLCENGHSYWNTKGMSACGTEWKAGTRCVAPTSDSVWGLSERGYWTTVDSCNSRCADGYSWWTGAGGHRCGREPCWGAGTVCGAGTTCNACCSGAEAPWYWFGVGKCR